jgi:hypothetical protein
MINIFKKKKREFDLHFDSMHFQVFNQKEEELLRIVGEFREHLDNEDIKKLILSFYPDCIINEYYDY